MSAPKESKTLLKNTKLQLANAAQPLKFNNHEQIKLRPRPQSCKTTPLSCECRGMHLRRLMGTHESQTGKGSDADAIWEQKEPSVERMLKKYVTPNVPGDRR